MSRRNIILQNTLLVVDVIVMIILILSFVLMGKCDEITSSKKNHPIKVENYNNYNTW